MEFWRYLRDVMIVIGVLLLLSGLAVGWGLICLVVWGASLVSEFVWDRRQPDAPSNKHRPF